MKKYIWIMVCAVAGLASSTRADLIHRYVFSNNVNDTVGSVNMTSSSSGSNVVPSYVTAQPTGSVGPNLAASFGDSLSASPVKQSGASLTNSVIGSTGTMCFWVKPDQWRAPLADYILNSSVNGFTAVLTIGGANLGLTMAGQTKSFTPGAITNWQFIAFTWDNAAGTGTITLNGQTENVSWTSGALTPSGTLEFGRFNSKNTDNAYDGLIYDVQIYDTALSGASLATLAANPGSVIPEPATIGMLGLGALVTVLLRHIRK